MLMLNMCLCEFVRRVLQPTNTSNFYNASHMQELRVMWKPKVLINHHKWQAFQQHFLLGVRYSTTMITLQSESWKVGTLLNHPIHLLLKGYHQLSFKVRCFGHCLCCCFYGHFTLISTWNQWTWHRHSYKYITVVAIYCTCWGWRLTTEDDWLNLIIFFQGPQEEATQVQIVNELSFWSASAPDNDICVVP